jgi:hypothetical protein
VTGGTAAAPGLSFSGDPNTGLYSPGADTLALSAGGYPRVTVRNDNTSGILLVDGAGGGATGLPAHYSTYITSYTGTSGSRNGLMVKAGWWGDSNDTVARFSAFSGGGEAPLLTLLATGALSLTNQWAGFAGPISTISSVSAPSASYSFLQTTASASGTPDAKQRLNGDGTVAADGAYSGSGADYAEYFRWADGNPDREDRRGLAVVAGGCVRPATAADAALAIIGVVSANPTVIGDAAWSYWTGKYQRDDYGSLVTESCELVSWEDAEGRSHSAYADAIPDGVALPPDARRERQSRPALNPDYDPSLSYTPRAERPEWATIGLMGKLRLRAGQPTADRWLRLRVISEGVEEWLVR